MTEFREPEGGWTPPAEYLRPPLMAIGDSLLNGMRSYSINDMMAAQSIPAVLAGAITDVAESARFQRARYPRPVLIDVEATLRSLPDSILAAFRERERVLAEIAENARFWLGRFDSPVDQDMPLFFDNIAIAGTEDFEVFDETAAGLEALARAFLAAGDLLSAKVAFPSGTAKRRAWDSKTNGMSDRTHALFIDLHIAINGRHLLNPRNVPALKNLRPIDQVALRRPRVLLHSLGHNSGLFDITMNGKPEAGLAALNDYARGRWPARAETLAALPRQIGRIIVQLLPLPGQVPNLMPHQVTPNPLRDGYHDRTFAAFRVPNASGTVWYTRAQMRRFDDAVRGVNDAIAQAARRAFASQADRLVIFDVPGRFNAYDAKHGNGQPVTVTDAAGTRRFTNHGFASYRGGGHRSFGGIGSLDNHHPSALGYRLFARELADALRTSLGGTYDPARIEVTDAGDPLLANPPALGMRVLRRLYDITTIPFDGAMPGAEAPIATAADEITTFGELVGAAPTWVSGMMAAPRRR
jgi:hypothetical protein